MEMVRQASTSKGPQFVRYFAPVLDAVRALGGSGRPAEVEEWIVSLLGLSEAEISQVTKNGQSRYSNQVAWARFYLAKAGLLDSSSRGVWRLTEKGNSTHLTHELALQLFREVHVQFPHPATDPSADSAPLDTAPDDTATQPSTAISDYRVELLAALKSLPPAGFERVCQRLLRESGFQQVTITGRTGDGGIDGDGVVQVNPFVSFRVLFQCKRYDSSAVGSGQVRDFRGAMAGRADKGIILTTGSFSADAKKEAIRDGVPPIELVDGEKLVNMFELLELGVRPVCTFKVDEGFVDEFR
jgi:restriction system protein